MDIRLPSSLLPIQISGKSVAALLSQLQPGQQVTAVVETQLAENSFLLKLGDNGQTLRAQTQLNLLPGQTLKLQVLRTGTTPELKVLPPTDQSPSVETSTIQQAFRELLPKQQSLAGLASQLTKFIDLPEAAQKNIPLPEPAKSAIQATMDALPKKNELLTADGLKRAVADSGLFFEAKLAAMPTQGNPNTFPKDLKGLLLTLSQQLQTSDAKDSATPSLPISPPSTRTVPDVASQSTPKILTQTTDPVEGFLASSNADAVPVGETTSQRLELSRDPAPTPTVKPPDFSTSTAPPPASTSSSAPVGTKPIPPAVAGTVVDAAPQGDATQQTLPQSTVRAEQPLSSPLPSTTPALNNASLSSAGQSGPVERNTAVTPPMSEAAPQPKDLPKPDTNPVVPAEQFISKEPLAARASPTALPMPTATTRELPPSTTDLPRSSEPTPTASPLPPQQQHPTTRQTAAMDTLPNIQPDPKHMQQHSTAEKALREFIQAQGQSITLSDQPSTELRSLHQQTEGALARIVLDQLASLPNGDGKLLSWQLEIPFTDGRDVGSAKLNIAKDSSAPGASLEQPFWSVIVEISPPGLGTIHSRITLNGERVNTYFWADQVATAERIQAGLDTLAARLRQAGLDVGQIDTLPGPPADLTKKLPALASKILDERA